MGLDSLSPWIRAPLALATGGASEGLNAINNTFQSPGGFTLPSPSSELQSSNKNYQNLSARSPEELQKTYLQDTQGAGKSLGLDPTTQSLNSRANRIMQSRQAQMQGQATLGGAQNYLNRKTSAQSFTQNLSNYQRGIMQEASDYQMKAEAARAQVMGQIFGGLGNVGGFAAGGGFGKKAGSGGGGASSYQPPSMGMFSGPNPYA